MKKLCKLTKSFLMKEYTENKKSSTEIGKETNDSKRVVLYWLKKFNIRRRTSKEALKGKSLKERGHKENCKCICCKSKRGETKRKNNSFYGKRHTQETKKLMGRKGKENPNWKGERKLVASGYIYVYSPNHPHKTGDNRVFEHRLIVEKYLKRYLTKKERGHHVNGIKNDNRIENLMGFSSSNSHKAFHRNPKLVKSEDIIFDGRKVKGGK